MTDLSPLHAVSVITVVLATGNGARLGGPEARIAWPVPGESPIPLAIAHARARLAAESVRVLVVTRQTTLGHLLRFAQPGIDLVVSDPPGELDQAATIAFAASRVGDAHFVVVTPVETPPAKSETVAQLVAKLAEDPKLLAARPRYQGRDGQPVVLRQGALTPYRGTRPPALRDHLKSLGAACAVVDVTDATVQLALDTPAHVVRVLRALPQFVE